MTAVHPSGWRRLSVLVAVAIILVGAGIVGRMISYSNGSNTISRSLASKMPATGTSNAPSSQWFCASPRSLAGTYPGNIDVVNRSSRNVVGTGRWVNESGSDVAVTSVSSPAASQVSVASPIPAGSYQAAAFQFKGGQVAVWQSTGGPGGESVSPCSSFTSATWHFAGGDANGEDRLAYILYNPTSTDAVIDISFTDQTGPENPNEFQAIFVPAGRLAVADVTSRFFGDSQIAATVKCRLGQIVAFQMELHPSAPASTTSAVPPAGSGGVSVLLGAPSTGPDWYFPEGVTSQNIPEDIYLYNPGATAAKVQISAYLDAGSASPIMVEVPAQGELDVALNQEARIPRSINHYFYIHVTKGPPIVAFQSMGTPVPSASPTQVAVAGSNQSAHPWINMNLGIRKAFREWVAGGTPLQFTGAVNSNSSDLGKGSAVAGSQQGAPILDRVPNASGFRETLIVANPGNSTISFSVAYLERGHASSVPGMADETVSAGGHDYLQLPPAAMPSVAPGGDFEVAATLPGVLVIAEGPITVVQEWTSQGIPGWTSSAAIPVSG